MPVNQTLQDHHDLYQRIQNKKRRDLMEILYTGPQNYSNLIETTQLKPGSLYHHLRVLDDLVHQNENGNYELTSKGRQLAEDILELETTRPKIQQSEADESQLDQINREVESRTQVIYQLTLYENIQENLWIGWQNIVLISFIAIISILLSIEGVSLAGSAIYAIGFPISLVFDFLSFILGFLVIYIFEDQFSSSKSYNKLLFTLNLRVIMMLPASFIGLGLYVLFIFGITPSGQIFPFLFALSVSLGYIILSNGIQYLRGLDQKTAVTLALIPTSIDILLGLVVLLTA